MDFTPQNVCGFLIRSRLMAAEDMHAMKERWQTEAKDKADNLQLFTKWLVTNQYVTEYQANLLAKGHGDPDDYFLNQYRIMERLGRGRMAGVYKAVHTLGQVVAIKVLPPSRAKNPLMLGRFQREARLALRLKHPNVVRSFQIGQTNSLYYLVMEYLEGETLEDTVLRRKRLPPAEAVRLVHQALMGLQHIHELGMVHRDLKPANMMLVPAPAKGKPDTTSEATVKILDIGLGRLLFEEDATEGEENLELTGSNVILGTPDYLAPEQARDAHDIDIRADIYSLGCVLYHLLTGQPPFPSSNIINQMVRHATEAAKPLRQFNPAIPDGLQQIVNYMMAKEADQRYPTPERAAQALQMFLLADSRAPEPLEELPQMRKYLTWLETAPQQPEPTEAPLPSANLPVAKPVAPSPRTSRPTPVPAARSDALRKKHKKNKGAKPERILKALPAQTLNPQEFDVELVNYPTSASAGQKTFGLTKREWILLAVGAGALTVAIGIGVLVAVMLMSGS